MICRRHDRASQHRDRSRARACGARSNWRCSPRSTPASFAQWRRVTCSPKDGTHLPCQPPYPSFRKPQHAGLYLQMVGRVLRPSPGKTHATLIDLCGSVHDHGPPDIEREYTLDAWASRNWDPLDHSGLVP